MDLETLLSQPRTVAVVGLSDNPARPSFGVAMALKRQGWTVFPVNPMLTEWQGQPCWPDLASIPHAVEVVDVFRRSEEVPEVARAAVAKGALCLWQQLGVVSAEADRVAREAGLLSVMNLCLKVELARRGG